MVQGESARRPARSPSVLLSRLSPATPHVVAAEVLDPAVNAAELLVPLRLQGRIGDRLVDARDTDRRRPENLGRIVPREVLPGELPGDLLRLRRLRGHEDVHPLVVVL